MAQKAQELKEQGNIYFQNANYTDAEECYTQAILKDPTNPKLFTNRAMTRLKLSSWDAVLTDALKALDLDPHSMKAYYHLAQAQLALHHPNEAYNSAITAYEKCVETKDRSIQNVSRLVLEAKKGKWEYRERIREREWCELLRECEEGVWRVCGKEIGELVGRGGLGRVEEAEERERLEGEARAKVGELRSVFAVADPKNVPKREVPDYLIDSVTFSVMHDPVITRTGISYDRSTMVEHLKRSDRDPLTGEPLRMEDLRPNRALKEACQEFLEANGWAVDW